MTLIIGFKCVDGIVLVSDTKIIDTITGDLSYDSKILTPLQNMPCIVGLAGYVNLFNEFNRKIPETVQQHIAKNRILNVEELLRTGLTRDKSIEYVQSQEKCMSPTLRWVQNDEKNECPINSDIAEIELPYQYSEENFIDDCKFLIKQICSQDENNEDPLEILLGVKRPSDKKLHLHQIYSDGTDMEIENYAAIGSGYPFVEGLFGQVYDYNKEIYELITHAFRTIVYAILVAKESTVGYSKDHLPEAVVIHNDGKYGKMLFSNESQIIQEIEVEMKSFVNNLKNSHISILKPKQ